MIENVESAVAIWSIQLLLNEVRKSEPLNGCFLYSLGVENRSKKTHIQS